MATRMYADKLSLFFSFLALVFMPASSLFTRTTQAQAQENGNRSILLCLCLCLRRIGFHVGFLCLCLRRIGLHLGSLCLCLCLRRTCKPGLTVTKFVSPKPFKVVSLLRLKHNIKAEVCQLTSCDYIVSNRMAVKRKSASGVFYIKSSFFSV